MMGSEPESVVPNLDLASALSVGLRGLHTVPPGVAQICAGQRCEKFS